MLTYRKYSYSDDTRGDDAPIDRVLIVSGSKSAGGKQEARDDARFRARSPFFFCLSPFYRAFLPPLDFAFDYLRPRRSTWSNLYSRAKVSLKATSIDHRRQKRRESSARVWTKRALGNFHSRVGRSVNAICKYFHPGSTRFGQGYRHVEHRRYTE